MSYTGFSGALSGKVAQKVIWVINLEKTLSGEKNMSDLQKYIDKRKKIDQEFSINFDEGYKQFKIGIILRQARESAGFTQQELAKQLNTKKSAISRMENHAEDIKLSTLIRIASSLGKRLNIDIS